MARGHAFIGTSGFSFKEWKGNFYPEDLPDKKMLSHYSTKLPSVEINYTFRRMPSESTLEGWKGQTEDGFRFTLKAPQRITHFKRLKDASEDTAEFVKRAKLLGDRLGTILFQLPPNMKFERDRFESFVASLDSTVRCAFEFRHESWSAPEVSEILSASGVAICGADTEKTPLELVPETANYVYMRLRREEYETERLSMWAKRISEKLDEGRDVYCYFKHEGGGVGPQYATAVIDGLQ